MADISKEIISILSKNLYINKEKIDLKHFLTADLKADYLDLYAIAVDIEVSLDVNISDEIEELDTVEDLINWVKGIITANAKLDNMSNSTSKLS